MAFGDRNPTKIREWQQRSRKPLARSQMTRTAAKPKRQAVSPASPEQRAKVRDQRCIVCGRDGVTPMHVIDRSLGGDDDPLAVVPGCADCHRAYDEQGLDLSPYLEPNHRAEAAYAVELIGLERAYRRITNAGRG